MNPSSRPGNDDFFSSLLGRIHYLARPGYGGGVAVPYIHKEQLQGIIAPIPDPDDGGGVAVPFIHQAQKWKLTPLSAFKAGSEFRIQGAEFTTVGKELCARFDGGRPQAIRRGDKPGPRRAASASTAARQETAYANTITAASTADIVMMVQFPTVVLLGMVMIGSKLVSVWLNLRRQR